MKKLSLITALTIASVRLGPVQADPGSLPPQAAEEAVEQITVPMLRKGGVTYAVYQVETTDSNASQVRSKTPAGVKAERNKT